MKIENTNIITIHDRAIIDDDKEAMELLSACLTRSLWQSHQAGTSVDIFCAKRGTQGGSHNHEWLEFGCLVKYVTGGQLFIGCIQRTKGASFEFHS